MRNSLVMAGALCTILALCTGAIGSTNPDYVAGLAALRVGDTAAAKAKLAKAYATGRKDPHVKYAWAMVAPCSTAVILYKEIAGSAEAPDSLKAQANAKLGDHAMALGKCAGARENYRGAAGLDKNPRYRHLWALASQCNGDDETAKSLWHTLAQEKDSAIAQVALCSLGKLFLKRGEYDQAYSTFLKAGATGTDNAWAAAVLLGKYESARHLGLTDKASLYKKQLDTLDPGLLEAQRLQTVSLGIVAKAAPGAVDTAAHTAAGASRDTAKASPRYALQVGAFGSPENAEKLRVKLAKDYRDVTVVQTALSEQVFYRVRIGSFETKDAADTFGAAKLSKSGLSYRVVEK